MRDLSEVPGGSSESYPHHQPAGADAWGGQAEDQGPPRFPTESSGLRFLYASLITASRIWSGVKITPDIWWELETLRRQAFGEQNPTLEKELVAV